MIIKSLEIANFRMYNNQTFHFNPHFNLIIGNNGTGKTTILEALAVAVGSWFLGIRGQDSRHIQKKDIRRVVHFIEKRYDMQLQYPVKVHATGIVAEKEIQWKRELNSEKTTIKDAKSISTIAKKMADSIMKGDSTITLPLISYYGAGRHWNLPFDTNSKKMKKTSKDDSAPFLLKYNRFAGYKFSVDNRYNPNDLIRWIKAERTIEIDQDMHSPILRKVLQTIKSFAINFKDVKYSMLFGTLMFEKNDDDYIFFNDLSDGYQSILAMVGDLAMKAALLNPQFDSDFLENTPGIVMIDELDVHVHPSWQRHLIDDLKRTFPKIQFIVTSHSPFLVQSVPANELIILDSTPNPIDESDSPKGLEEVAETLMNVEQTQMSYRYLQMKKAALDFFSALENKDDFTNDDLQLLRDKYQSISAQYSNNPAYMAIIEMEALRKGVHLNASSR